MLLRSLTHTLAAILIVTGLGLTAQAETPVGSNVDSRVLVGVRVNQDALQTLMPEGWKSISWPSGPLKGSNLLIGLIDGILEMDPEGTPLDPPNRRAMVLVGLGKGVDGVRGYVLRIMTTVPERNPYSVAVPAAISRTRTLSDPAEGPRTVSDSWTIQPEGGGAVSITLDYTAGKRGWSAGESTPYSGADPTFSRIYRYDQMVDLVVSEGLGKPSSGSYDVTSSVPELSGLFDGSEKIMTVMDVPVYVRDVSLP